MQCNWKVVTKDAYTGAKVLGVVINADGDLLAHVIYDRDFDGDAQSSDQVREIINLKDSVWKWDKKSE